MRSLFFLLSLVCYAFAAEYDAAFIGTSPIPLFEALYRHHSGEKVLILEASDECGGAWRSIDICGVPHADMGCHEISSNPDLNQFLEEYGGCTMVSTHRNYYFSKGCFELVGNLVKRVRAAGIRLITECRVESVYVDIEQNEAILKTSRGAFTASKVVVTPGSSFEIENAPSQGPARGHKFYHLYLLLHDPNPPHFSYHSGVSAGISRMMNLTPFLEMNEKNRQLIVLQTYNETCFDKADKILDDLKRANLVSMESMLLQSDSYIFEQGPYFNVGKAPTQEIRSFFEQLNTAHFNMIHSYAPKWKRVLPTYRECNL